MSKENVQAHSRKMCNFYRIESRENELGLSNKRNGPSILKLKKIYSPVEYFEY